MEKRLLKRKLVGLTANQRAYIEEGAAKAGISRNEYLRRCLDEHIQTKTSGVLGCSVPKKEGEQR